MKPTGSNAKGENLSGNPSHKERNPSSCFSKPNEDITCCKLNAMTMATDELLVCSNETQGHTLSQFRVSKRGLKKKWEKDVLQATVT